MASDHKLEDRNTSVNWDPHQAIGAASRAVIAALALFLLGMLSACAIPAAVPATATAVPATATVEPVATTTGSTLANPASENCIAQGGTLAIETGPAGQFGVCYFEDNYQCEEWALLRGDCPVGGLRVTGYVTDAARYCAISGGTYATTGATTGDGQEEGTCTMNGVTCDVFAFYDGSCRP